MLAVKIGDKHIDLSEDATVSIEKNSTLFRSVQESIGKAYSYPFKIQLTDKTKRIIEFAHLINVVNNKTVYTGSVLYSENEIETGDLVLGNSKVDAKGKGIQEANLQITRKTDFFNSKKLTELYELGAEWVSENRRIWFSKNRFEDDNGKNRYALPVDLVLYVTGIAFTTEKTTSLDTNNWMQDLADQINAIPATNCTASVDSTNSPFQLLKLEATDPAKKFWAYPENSGEPALRYVYDTIQGVFLKDIQGKIDIVIDDNKNYDFCYTPFQFYTDNFGLQSVNRHNGTNFADDFISAQVKLPNAIRRIADVFGYQIESDWIDSDEIKDLCIFSPTSLGIYSNTTTNLVVRYYEKFFLFCHKLPNITFTEWLDELEMSFGLNIEIDFQLKILKINCLKNKVKAKKQNEIRYFDPAYKKTSWKGSNPRSYKYEIPEWVKYSKNDRNLRTSYEQWRNLYNSKGNTTENSVVPEFSPLPFKTTTVGSIRTEYIFYGNNDDRKELFDNTRFHYKEDGNEIDIPKHYFFYTRLASGIPSGRYFNSYFSLTWNRFEGLAGEVFSGHVPGLFEHAWQAWHNFLKNTCLIERNLYLSTAELIGFSLSSDYRVDNIDYFILQCRYDLSNKKITRHKVKAKLLPIW